MRIINEIKTEKEARQRQEQKRKEAEHRVEMARKKEIAGEFKKEKGERAKADLEMVMSAKQREE